MPAPGKFATSSNAVSSSFQWIELSTEEDCRRELGLADLKNVDLPVVELPDGTRLFGPTLRDVADRLGFVAKPKRRQYDVSIYGAGPAGLSAAVYAASEGLSTVLIERSAVGGPSRHHVDDRELHGLPARHQRRRSCRTRPATGGEVRGRNLDDAGGREIDVPRRSHLDRPRRRRDDGRPRQCLRHRRGVASSQPAQRG